MELAGTARPLAYWDWWQTFVAGLLWDRVGHAAVFYYGVVFAIVGIIGLLVLIPGGQHKHPEAVTG